MSLGIADGMADCRADQNRHNTSDESQYLIRTVSEFGLQCQVCRELSGQCNNLENKLWGATTMMLEQYLPQTYADGKGTPRGGWRSATDTTGLTGNQRVKKFADPCPRKFKLNSLLLNPVTLYREKKLNYHAALD